MLPHPTWTYTPEDAEVARAFVTSPLWLDPKEPLFSPSDMTSDLENISLLQYFLPRDLGIDDESNGGALRKTMLPQVLEQKSEVLSIETRERRRRHRRRKASSADVSAEVADEEEDAPEQSSDMVVNDCVMLPWMFWVAGIQDLESGDAGSKWHSSALSAGSLSQDSHIFVKSHAGPRKSHSNGMTLSSLCMLFERDLRVGGMHQYHYSIVEGSVGAADGVGFVFDSRIRRTNIQRMRSIFLNKHGQVCLRNLDSIIKLPSSLLKLSEGISVFLQVDLDNATASFRMHDLSGKPCGAVDLSFASLLADGQARSGFFCAIVTGSITVSLH